MIIVYFSSYFYKLQNDKYHLNFYGYHIKLLLKRLALVFILFQLSRLFFYLTNYNSFSGIGFEELIKLFFIGSRFDISAIFYSNLILILFHVLPFGKLKNNILLQNLAKWYFVIVNSLLIFINLIDAEYFSFIYRRSTADIIKYIFLSDDVLNLLPQFIIDYWHVPFLWFLSIIILWKFYPKINFDLSKRYYSEKNRNTFKTKFANGIIFLVTVILTIIGARGGLQLKPLTILHASKFTKPENIPLLLNTPFSIITTFNKQGLKERNYFSKEKAEKIFPTLHQYNFPDSSFKKMNVVIIILESFSREYSGYLNNYNGYTPFLDSLMKKSLVMTNAFSNGKRSIDAVPSILTSIPSLMNTPFITSPYSSNKILSLAHILKKEGYHTSFFHGASNGSMNFDGFASLAGFDNYYGRTEYNNEKDFDGKWGIFDEPFLQFFAKKLSSFTQPFFAVEFTISSHHPYTIPNKYKGKFKKGPLKIHETINYTDYALKHFFETASETSWYNNTIFVLLADHPAQTVDMNDNLNLKESDKLSPELIKYYKSTAGKFAIPILYFVPLDSTIVKKDDMTTQQSDVLPSVLNYLKYNKKFIAFGNSIFDTTAKHVAFDYLNSLYSITENRYSLIFDGEQSLSLYNNKLDVENKNNLLEKEKKKAYTFEQTLKAIIQQYNYRLINNKLLPE